MQTEVKFRLAGGAQVEGNIGYNYLKEFEVTIDYPNEILRLG
jgi:hypothetical protein